MFLKLKNTINQKNQQIDSLKNQIENYNIQKKELGNEYLLLKS